MTCNHDSSHTLRIQSKKQRPETQLVIPATIRTIISTTALGTTPIANHQIAVRLAPGRIQPLQAAVVRVQQLPRGPNIAAGHVADDGLRDVRLVRRVGHVVAQIVFGDVFGAGRISHISHALLLLLLFLTLLPLVLRNPRHPPYRDLERNIPQY